MMSEEVQSLAQLLRLEADKLLSNECKLSLSTDLIDELNDLFNTNWENYDNSLTSSFHVLNCNPTEINRDLIFLHNIVQKSKSLKLSLGKPRDLHADNIDISKFKSLSLLELHKINVDNITGLSNLRSKLKFLICERSLNNLRDIFERCGADDSDGSNFYELKEAVLRNNSIKTIDDSLKYLPMLTTLDLSFNLIKNCDEIKILVNLKYLNLSFNKLEKVPLFSGQICSRLQVLILKNNFIDDLENVCKLKNLTQLDLGDNCLLEHNDLISISYLCFLQLLNLNGNPLSYHPLHRINTVKFLHSYVLSLRFILDGNILSENEKKYVGSLYPKRFYKDDKCEMNSFDESNIEGNLERSMRVRPAIINENQSEEEVPSEKITISVSVEVPNQQKECLKSLPKDYIKSLYGKTGVSPFDLEGSLPSSSTPLQEYISDEIAKVNQPKPNKPLENLENTEEIKNISDENTFYDDKSESEEEKLSDDDFESGDSNIFLVNIKNGKSDVFVIFGKSHLIERNAITSKVLSKISLDSITLCSKTLTEETEYIYIEFETFRNSNCRCYLIENPEERERFFERIQVIIEARPASEAHNVFTCLKCSTQFGVEEQNTIHKDKIVCPACKSDLVFEDNS